MDQEQALQGALVAQDFLVPTGVRGLFGYGRPMVELLDSVQRLIVTSWDDPGLRSIEFPAVMARSTLERSGYLETFPQLAGRVSAMPVDAGATAGTALLADTAYALAPASCYPVYRLYTGRIPDDGESVQVVGRCFRHEPSEQPERLVSFRQLEFVRIADAARVDSWYEAGQQKMAEIGRRLRLDTVVMAATDPFFGPAGRVLSARQRNDGAKFELCASVGVNAAVAIASANRHREHLTRKFDIRTGQDTYAESACVAFGLERIALALLTAHGTNPRGWPVEVSAGLA